MTILTLSLLLPLSCLSRHPSPALSRVRPASLCDQTRKPRFKFDTVTPIDPIETDEAQRPDAAASEHCHVGTDTAKSDDADGGGSDSVDARVSEVKAFAGENLVADLGGQGRGGGGGGARSARRRRRRREGAIRRRAFAIATDIAFRSSPHDSLLFVAFG
eukprot:CAMPEP_0183315152 /NCGR_PEP_ID=MMETSP0160_2-20130417/50805_1 /TAXON_ID=2839 ORGANISM="Odontella Sinensis, Strain Grunow 1884" /NCGR_SAMPLE_ID=MMETSP0160_2 /ASSEMBLY_ACC=CAM_ASM_000250 /LENGTH=159 /DNA_ID=CAMNT_0025480651 /DNA_START=212 /DNA_END=686 /DNA_ORIENTATION=+